MAWLQSTAGVLEQDGYGVSQERQRPYQVAIGEFKKNITTNPPDELTIADARRYIAWLQDESSFAARTQQARLTCMRNVLKIGVQQGLIYANPFSELTISTPAGLHDEQWYRPFSKQELIGVFETLKDEIALHYQLLPYVLLATGCRLNEAVLLRTTDIKQTEAGLWYIDWRLPKHQRKAAARVFPDAPSNNAFSQWFKKKLIGLEMWEKKKTVLHSIGDCARDLWRASGMPQDYRKQ